MMNEIAFMVKGQTFFKIIAPLVIFARKNLTVHCHMIVYCERKGKSYDNVSQDVIEKIRMSSAPERRIPYVPLTVTWVSGDAEARAVLKKRGIRDVVCQDAQHHFSFLRDDFRVFSMSVYTDTLHYAAHQYKKGTWLPYKTYFPSELLREKTQELSGVEWNSVALGSPMLDHQFWVARKNEAKRSVVFLTPPNGTLYDDTLRELASLARHCRELGISFMFKPRARFPWPHVTPDMQEISVEETALPYASMKLMCDADLVIAAYSISIFEARALGVPALNLDVSDAYPNVGNVRVKRYGLDEVYDSGPVITRRTCLVDAFDELIDMKGFPARQITWTSNYSTDIMRDILKEIGCSNNKESVVDAAQ